MHRCRAHNTHTTCHAWQAVQQSGSDGTDLPGSLQPATFLRRRNGKGKRSMQPANNKNRRGYNTGRVHDHHHHSTEVMARGHRHGERRHLSAPSVCKTMHCQQQYEVSVPVTPTPPLLLLPLLLLSWMRGSCALSAK